MCNKTLYGSCINKAGPWNPANMHIVGRSASINSGINVDWFDELPLWTDTIME